MDARGKTKIVRDELLNILRCPADQTALAPVSDAILDQLNTAIRAKRIRNQAGELVEQTIEGGLVRIDGALLYPIVDQIPVLLPDEAILLNQIG